MPTLTLIKILEAHSRKNYNHKNDVCEVTSDTRVAIYDN